MLGLVGTVPSTHEIPSTLLAKACLEIRGSSRVAVLPTAATGGWFVGLYCRTCGRSACLLRERGFGKFSLLANIRRNDAVVY